MLIKNIKEELEKNYDVMFADVVASIPELKGLADNIQGRNLLFKRIIKKLAHKILDSDSNDLPFRIVDLERSVETEIEIYSAKEFQKVRLGGRIDRLDEKDGVVRIIDYKTGRFNPGKTDKMDGIFKNPDKREQFQAIFYAHLYSKENPSASLTAGIYSLQKMRGGIHLFLRGWCRCRCYERVQRRIKSPCWRDPGYFCPV